MSMKTRLEVGRPAVKKLASPQQASLEDCMQRRGQAFYMKQGPKIFREVEIIPGCAAVVARPSCPDHSLEPPGPGRVNPEHVGLVTVGENRSGSGVWLFRGALQGKNLFSLR